MITFLGKYWRELVIAILGIAVFFSMQTCSKQKSDKLLLESLYKDTVRTYVNKNKELVSQIETREVTIDQLKEYGEQLDIDNKRLKKTVGSLNNLVGFWKGKASVTDSVVIVNHDTVFVDNGEKVTGKWFAWNNKFMQIQGITTERTTSLTYQYEVDFSLTTYRKRSGFLNMKKGPLLSDLYFSDPNFRVQEFKGIVIKEPPKKFYERNTFWGGLGLLIGFFASQ